MRQLTADMHHTEGNGGRAIMKIRCASSGELIAADICRIHYCKANRGYKEMVDENGRLTIETRCGFKELVNTKENA